MERVLRERVRGRQRQVLVKWKGYLTPTWESAAALADTEAYRVFKAGDNVTGLGPDYIPGH